MKPALPLLLALTLAAGAAPVTSQDVPSGYLPAAWIGPALRKVLSPQGRFLLLTPNGPVRITDTQAKIEDAVDALEKLQHTPALVNLSLNFTVFGKKEVERKIVQGPSGGGDEFPYPTRFAPPKITRNGNTIVVVPTTPISFSTRAQGAGQTITTTDVVQTRDVIKRLAVSSVPEKPSALPVLAKAADPVALQALAVKLGALPGGEPAWTAAATELVVESEFTGGQLIVKVTPQIVLPGAAPGAQPRRLPLPMCAAGIPMVRGANSPQGTLPRTDAEFYRLFMGAPPAAPDAVTALSVAADVRYLGTPPP